MKKLLIVPFIVLTVCIIVIYGWLTANSGLVMWFGEKSAVLPSTALSLCFFSISLILMISDQIHNRVYKEIGATFFAAWMVGITTFVVYAGIYGNHMLLENIFLRQQLTFQTEGIFLKTYPAVSTVIALYLLALVSWIYIHNTFKVVKRTRWIAYLVSFIAVTALIGHSMELEWLYFKNNYSNGMSLMTASLLLLLSYAVNELSNHIQRSKIFQKAEAVELESLKNNVMSN